MYNIDAPYSRNHRVQASSSKLTGLDDLLPAWRRHGSLFMQVFASKMQTQWIFESECSRNRVDNNLDYPWGIHVQPKEIESLHGATSASCIALGFVLHTAASMHGIMLGTRTAMFKSCLPLRIIGCRWKLVALHLRMTSTSAAAPN